MSSFCHGDMADFHSSVVQAQNINQPVMITRMATVLKFFGAVVVVGVVATSSAAVAGQDPHNCFRDWAAAQNVVREHRLSTVDQVSQFARKLGAGQVVKAVLCRDGDRFEYRVILRDGRGQLTRHIVTARAPFTVRRQFTRRQGGKAAALGGAIIQSGAPTSVAIVSPSPAK